MILGNACIQNGDGNAIAAIEDPMCIIGALQGDAFVQQRRHGNVLDNAHHQRVGGQGRQGDDFQDALSLHIQRSVDSFERQATLMAIRHVVLSLPAMSYAGREGVASSVPADTRIFDLEHWVDIDDSLLTLLRGHEELHALACVAACRLLAPVAVTAKASAETSAAKADSAATTPAAPAAPAATTADLPPLQMPSPAAAADASGPRGISAEPGATTPPRPGEKPADQWMLQP